MNKKTFRRRCWLCNSKTPNLLYNCYMPFLEHGGLFVPTDDVFSLGEDILLAVEIADYPQTFPANQSRLDQSRAPRPIAPKA